ncbi:hypothetical protein OEZ85_007563 [Tetradesmus obliquus]|uniref:Formamidopyrimidine-DNA glycosylase H2TH DNA-binding domain-containing protein n=1 Tax=Tetradesmus obliquus TaxID=3088 RepID=A0ABY8TGL0_TETOB|nr:hypothetical protein OEZ85_007563 [Tetradesmus obliquus]
MVEGHQCHRVGAAHRRLLIGKAFEATSPNGRFVEGAAAITGKVLSRIEVHGKNLFYFFSGSSSGSNGSGPGSSSAAAAGTTPPPAATAAAASPAVLPSQLVAHLSAVTVQHGGLGLYQEKVSKLGPDPLRPSDDKERFWARVSSSRKPIGLLLMDQSAVAGVGNIYRAEILFKARVHPEQPGNSISRAAFDTIWGHCVELLRRGFSSGSILTVDPEDAKTLGKPWTRRYIYNQRQCGVCKGPVTTWDMAGRTVYCCSTCQLLQLNIASGTAAAAAAAGEAGKAAKSRKRPDSKSSKQDSTATAAAAAVDAAAAAAKQLLSPSRLKSMAAAQVAKEFVSHCAPDDPAELAPSKMTCALLRQALLALSMDARGTKQQLVERLEAAQAAMAAAPAAAAAAGGVAVNVAGSSSRSSSEDEVDRAEERLAGNLSVPAAKRRRVARKPTAAAAAAADSAAVAAPVTPSPKPSSSAGSRRRRPRSTAASPAAAAAAAAAAVPAGGNDLGIASASAAAAEKAAAGENRAVEHVALFADAATEAMMFGGQQQE